MLLEKEFFKRQDNVALDRYAYPWLRREEVEVLNQRSIGGAALSGLDL
jgi:hypothetical protein